MIVTNGDDWEMYEVFKQAVLEERLLMKLGLSQQPAHKTAHKNAIEALAMWRPNLTSEEPVFISPKSAPDRPKSPPNDGPPTDSEKCYTLTLERRYPRHTTPTRLKIGNRLPVKVDLWLDVIHEIVAWLVEEKILRSNDCPIEIGSKIFIARRGAVNRDDTPIKNPQDLPNNLILQRGNTSTVLQWRKLRQLLDQHKDRVDQSTIQVFYKLTGKASR